MRKQTDTPFKDPSGEALSYFVWFPNGVHGLGKLPDGEEQLEHEETIWALTEWLRQVEITFAEAELPGGIGTFIRQSKVAQNVHVYMYKNNHLIDSEQR